MRTSFLRWLYLAAALAWAGVAWVSYHRSTPAADARPAPQPAAAEKHYVTPKQLTESAAQKDRRLGNFSALTHDGRRLSWAEVCEDRPVLLVFIKKGCPCSVEFEPFFHRLEKNYGDSVRFRGVIDGDQEAARAYAEANKVPYPVLADADRSIIHRFKAENGGYVALVRPDGTVDTLWPGCSATMMRELSQKIATVASVEERTLDTTGMPVVLTTGCPFAP